MDALPTLTELCRGRLSGGSHTEIAVFRVDYFGLLLASRRVVWWPRPCCPRVAPTVEEGRLYCSACRLPMGLGATLAAGPTQEASKEKLSEIFQDCGLDYLSSLLAAENLIEEVREILER